MKHLNANYLQVFGDGVRWAVGDHEDGVGLADHPVADLYEPRLPVIHAGSHGGHAQSRVVGVVQFPAGGDGYVRASEDAINTNTTKTKKKKASAFGSRNLHVAVNHFAGILGSVVEVLQVGLHLAQSAPHPQLVDVSVPEDRLRFVDAVPADFHHLGNAVKERNIL